MQLHYRVKVGGKQQASATLLKSGVAFSTKDMDNDENENEHCAQKYQNGWWYTHCTPRISETFKIRPVHMAIRPQ